MRSSFLLPLLSLLIASCADTSRPVSPPVVDEDAYAVYSAVIDSLFVSGQITNIVICELTDPYTMSPEFLRDQLGVPQSLSDRYHDANAVSLRLQRRLTIRAGYGYLPAATVAAIISTGGWEEFYRRYPNSQGFMSLSGVGFSPDGAEALVHVSNTVGFLAGAGQAVYLRRVQGRWILIRWTGTWIS